MNDFKDIVVGLDLTSDGKDVSPVGRRAVRQARWVAEANGDGKITLLHSVWLDNEAEPVPEAGERARAAVDAMATELRGDLGSTPVEVVVEFTEDRPWMAMAKHSSDLVVVGKHGYGEPRPPGPNVKKLLRICASPVWVVDPHSREVGRCILAATDLSAVGERATRLAARIAQASGASLHIVHAWQKTMQFQLEAARMSDEDVRAKVHEIEEDLRKRILAGLGDVPESVDPILHIGIDAPERAISAGVERLDTELVVMGTLSRSGIPGLVIGNTAERIVLALPCSTLTIKPKDFVSPASR